MKITIALEFVCKNCRNFKTDKCAEPKKAKAKHDCEHHSGFKKYSGVFKALGRVMETKEEKKVIERG